MNTKNLEKLKKAILSELDCNIGDFSPSQRVIDIIDRNGHEFSCLIDFRSDKRFNDGIFSFTAEFMQDLKAINKNHSDRGLIVIANRDKTNKIFILNPRNSLITGFNHHKSYDERGELIHHYIKIMGR